MSFKGLGSDNKRLLPALILIGLGVVGILSGAGLLRFLGGFIWGVVFAGAAYFAYTEGRKRGNNMWRLAAFPLAGLAIASVTSASFGGAAFLAALGLTFALVWHDDKRRWWAMIPAGTFASLAAVTFFEPIIGGSAGWLFLAGLAATFYALTRFEVDPQPWAFYPAVALGVVALLSFTTSGGWVLPLLLIAAGIYLLMRAGVINLPRGGSTAPIVPERGGEGDFLTTVPHRPVTPQGPSAPAAPAPAPTTVTPPDSGSERVVGEQAAVLDEFDEPTRPLTGAGTDGNEGDTAGDTSQDDMHRDS